MGKRKGHGDSLNKSPCQVYMRQQQKPGSLLGEIKVLKVEHKVFCTSENKNFSSNTTLSHQINFIPNCNFSVFSKKKQQKTHTKIPLPRESVHFVAQGWPFSNAVALSECVLFMIFTHFHTLAPWPSPKHTYTGNKPWKV